MSSAAPMQHAQTDTARPTQQSSQLSPQLVTQSQQVGINEAQHEFADLRPQATTQRKLQEAADNSPQNRQFQAFQQMAQNSARSTQLKTMCEMMNAPALQRVTDEEEPLQAKMENSTVQREEAASAVPKPNNTGLPDNLRSGIESLSGMSMDHVKVHYNSSKPAQLNAHAYAQGSEIHVAPGQEQHVPHEAWHIVQQGQGRVRPTMQMKAGIPVNDDVGLEHEADVMGGKALGLGAVQMKTGGNIGMLELTPSSTVEPVTLFKPNLAAPVQKKETSSASVVQRKLLFDAGSSTYSIDGGDTDYVFVGKYKEKNRYVKFEDLPLIKQFSDSLWSKIKALYGETPNSNIKKIKEGEETNDFAGKEHLAPGENDYESERSERTKDFLVGIHAPGKACFLGLTEEGGAWKELQFYHADHENDDNATSMTATAAKTIFAESGDLFIAMLQQLMIAQAEPAEKPQGGGANRTAPASGKVMVKLEDEHTFEWTAEDNPYKDVFKDPTIEGTDDLNVEAAKAGAVKLKSNGKDAVYVPDGVAKMRKTKNFYIGGKAYKEKDVKDKKADDEITVPWNTLKTKVPQDQHAETFTRKDRGKGQADAMGKWSANAAVVASNLIEDTDYDDSLAWEWLHLRGAGLGGATASGNLTPGTYNANSEMIPIENKIKSLKNKPDVKKLVADFKPKNVSGVFAKEIEMTIKVDYHGILGTQIGAWLINTVTGNVFDKIHEKKLKDDINEKTNQQIVGSQVVLHHASGPMTGPCGVLRQVSDNLFEVEFTDDNTVMATRDEEGRFNYDDLEEN